MGVLAGEVLGVNDLDRKWFWEKIARYALWREIFGGKCSF